MPSRFPIVCLVFLAQILGTEIILIIKGKGMGRLEKKGFIRTQKATQSKSALLMQMLKSTGLEIETSKHFLIHL